MKIKQSAGTTRRSDLFSSLSCSAFFHFNESNAMEILMVGENRMAHSRFDVWITS